MDQSQRGEQVGSKLQNLRRQQEDFILLLAERYKPGLVSVPVAELWREMGITAEQGELIVASLWRQSLFEQAIDGDTVIPRPECIGRAQEIEAGRAPGGMAQATHAGAEAVQGTARPDYVAKAWAWARGRRAVAALIVFLLLLSFLAGLVYTIIEIFA